MPIGIVSGAEADIVAPSAGAMALFVEFAPAAMAMFDRQMRYLVANKRWSARFRSVDENLLGRCHYDVFPEIPESWKDVHRRCLAGATEKCDEDRWVRPDGTVSWLRWEVQPWRDAAGEVGGIIVLTEDITERKRLEENLRESEWRFRELGARSRDVIWIIGVNPHRLLYVSPAVELVWGTPPSAHYQDPRLWEQYVHPEDRDRVMRAWTVACALGAEGRFDEEYRIVLPDGSICWLSDYLTPFRDPATDEVVGLSGVSRDITQRKHLEEQLREESFRNQIFLRTASDGVHIQDADGKLVEVSDSFCRMLGYERHELIGLHPASWDAQLLNEKLETTIAELFSGALKRFNTVHRRKDGSTFPVEIHVDRFTLNEAPYLYCSSRDMTEHHRTEAALRASERKSRLMFDSAVFPGALISLPDRVLRDVNDAWVRLFGYSRGETIGKTGLELGIIADDAARADAIRAADETGELREREVEFTTKAGKRLFCRVESTRVSVDGKQHALFTLRDVTEQRLLERAVLESTTAAQQKLGRDLHDGLGQELTGIAMLTSAARSSLKKDNRSEAAILERVEAVAKQAIINCRAIAHGLSPVEYAAGGLAGSLNEMVTLQRDSFGVDAHLSVHNAESLRLAPDAAENLYRIAQEAVTNARRHGHAKSIDVNLTIQPDRVRLEIRDSGVGIAAAPPTTGMGLKTMRLRVASIGGALSVGPGPQGGTVVCVECPQGSPIP